MEFFGTKLMGVNAENGQKLLLSVAAIGVLVLLRWILRGLVRLFVRGTGEAFRERFWTHQAVSLFCAALMLLAILSIWFDNPQRLATAGGLVTAGVAFALQQVITAFAGYFVILRGKTFSVGDRIMMGGVRGDVIALGFIQTTIMEMGQPPPVQSDAPAMWVQSRQFTGRIVTVSNAQIFNEPVYNYTRDFPYIWEEIHIPIKYQADRRNAEQILLTAASSHALSVEKVGAVAVARLKERYQVEPIDLEPRVFYRLTDNWIELSVRFVTETHRVRLIKDGISREIIEGFDAAGIEVASSTYDIVGFPKLELQRSVR